MPKKKKKSKKTSSDSVKKEVKKKKSEPTSLDSAIKETKKKKSEKVSSKSGPSPLEEMALDSTLKQKGPVSLDSATEVTEETKSALQGLLKGVSEGEGYFQRKEKGDEIIEPQLSHSGNGQGDNIFLSAADFISIGTKKKKKAVKEQPSFLEKFDDKETLEREYAQLEAMEVKREQKGAPPSTPMASSAPIAQTPPPMAKSSDIFDKLSTFFEVFIESYTTRYQYWENSISNLLGILRKMRKITKKNTEELEASITNIFDVAQEGLNLFKTKRDEVEKVAGVNIENMSSEFRRVLGMLEMQTKEYQFKRLSDELIHLQKIYS